MYFILYWAGKKTLTYDEMKKIFRGVALSQNDI